MSETQTVTEPHVLLVDDDAGLRLDIQNYLSENGVRVSVAHDAASMAAMLARNACDLVILDIVLPGEDGLSICRRLANSDAPPIIMLSARGDEIDRVVGLEIGADDYLPKPCAPRELLARIRAVLRRRARHPSDSAFEQEDGEGPREIYFDGFKVDRLLRRLYGSNSGVVVLTAKEFDLLMIFLEHVDQVLDRNALARLSGLEDVDDIMRAIDMRISRLRRKLAGDGGSELITTVRGQGYRFNTRVAVTYSGPSSFPTRRR